jgi:hypothetical protein
MVLTSRLLCRLKLKQDWVLVATIRHESGYVRGGPILDGTTIIRKIVQKLLIGMR